MALALGILIVPRLMADPTLASVIVNPWTAEETPIGIGSACANAGTRMLTINVTVATLITGSSAKQSINAFKTVRDPPLPFSPTPLPLVGGTLLTHGLAERRRIGQGKLASIRSGQNAQLAG
jgi:hypothetical protein